MKSLITSLDCIPWAHTHKHNKHDKPDKEHPSNQYFLYCNHASMKLER